MDRLIETRHLSAVDYREVTAQAGQQDDPNRWLFLPQTSGGSIPLPSRGAGQPSNQLYWHLHNHTTSTLTLAEISLSSGQVGRGVCLHIPGQVFSVVAHDVLGSTCCLFLLLSSRTVAVLQLQDPRQSQQRSSHNSSVLDGVRPSSLWQLQLPQQLAHLGVPTAMTAVDGYLCIGGSSGAVMGLPLAALAAGQLPAPGSVLQLNPSNFVVQVRRRMGFAANSGVVAVVPVDLPAAGHHSLLVMHEDTSCHQWFVGTGTGRQGFSATLVADAAVRQLRPNRVQLCHAPAASRRGSSAWDVLLVWDLGLADSSGQSDIRVMPFRLQEAAAAATAAGNARLEPLQQQPQLLQLEWPDASLLDAQVEGQQLLLLCSTKGGSSYVVSYSLRDWSYQGRCQLLQQRVSQDWGMKEEIWCCALAAVSDSGGGGTSCTAASQVLGQLLVPGQTCLSSLVAALAYYGAQMSQAEAASASLSQLQARITAAVELIKAKYPTYSAARCWHSLFATYCEVWQQQHAVLGLYVAPGGWLGAVRAGGLVSVLRKPSPAEVLLMESSQTALSNILQAAGAAGRPMSAIPGGAAALAKVRLCLSTLGELLGGPAMRVMTQAVMAGVSVDGELLPRFVELLLQGPPVVTHTGSSSSSMLAAGMQQRLSEWRLHRQTQLLYVHEQLADLPHALETLSGVAELTIKAATAAAAQLQPAASNPSEALNPGPQVGMLLSSIALHNTRASCMVLQQLLLLLGCIKQLGCVGATPLTAADQAAITSDLMPPLTTALRSAAVALWLCKTPASTPALHGATATGSGGLMNPSAPGPLLGLRNPMPAATPAGPPRGPGDLAAAAAAAAVSPSPTTGVAAAAPVWQQPLAAHLLALFWKQQGALQQQPGAAIGTAGAQLAVWLMLGAGAEAAAAAAAANDGTGGAHDAAALAHIAGRAARGSSSSSAAAAAAAVTSPEGLAGRGVLIGYQLFVCREYQAMQRLVTLIGGTDPAEAGLQFILGLSIACGLKKAQGGSVAAVTQSSASAEQHAALLDSAVGHLFRAAAGLCGDDSAPLRIVLQLLMQRQGSGRLAAVAAVPAAATGEATGMDTEEGQGMAGEEAAMRSCASQKEGRLRLAFCQAVLLLFEREGVTQGALAFARAALGAVDAAYLPHQAQEKLQQQAALWTSVFNFASELDLTHDAYTAALSNPVPERAAESVRRLVQALVDRGQLQQLLSLPWSGVLLLNRQGLQEPVPVVELVIDKLTRRALHSEVTLQPNAHQVLFDFLVAWGNYKAAAAAMLSYARRLRAAAAAAAAKQRVSADTVDVVVAAYAASTAMLQLLAPADAWLDPEQPLLAPFPAPAPLTGSSSSSNNSSRRANGRTATGLGSAAGMTQQPPVITLADLKQEVALFSASVLLLQQLPGLEVMQYGLTADYILEQLLGGQHFAAAVQLVHAVWGAPEQAGQLAEKLVEVAFTLAAACVKLQRGDDAGEASAEEGSGGTTVAGGEGSSASFSSLSQGVMSYLGPGHLASSAAAAWQKLRQLLELYNGGSTANGSTGSSTGSTLGGRLRLAAVDGALSTEPGLQLPAWLIDAFQPAAGTAGGMAGSGADPAGLLRLYIKHGRLVDAAQLVKDHFEAWQTQNALLRAAPAAVWLPLQDLELLHASLVAGAARAGAAQRVKDAEALGTWSEVLEAGLADHLALVKSDGEKLGAGAPSVRGAHFGGTAGMVF